MGHIAYLSSRQSVATRDLNKCERRDSSHMVRNDRTAGGGQSCECLKFKCVWANTRNKTLPLLKTPPPQAVPRALPLFKEGVRRSREGVRKEEELEYGKVGRELSVGAGSARPVVAHCHPDRA